MVYIVAVLLSVYPFYFTNFNDALGLFIAFWFFGYISVIRGIKDIKEKVYRDLESGHKNYLVIEKLGARLFSMILVLMLFFLISYKDELPYNFGLFLLIDEYLLSCTPLSTGGFNKDQIPDTA